MKNIFELIEQTESEITARQEQIRELQTLNEKDESFLAGLRFAVEELGKTARKGYFAFHANSQASQSYSVILQERRPLHVREIVTALGLSCDDATIRKFSGVLAWHARRGQVFAKTAPRTFGLIEWKDEVEAVMRDAAINPIGEKT